MSVDHAMTIQGWMTGRELEWLAHRAEGSHIAIEFGSWCGRSSVAMSAAEHLICVDTWLGSQEHAEVMAAGFCPAGAWRDATARYPNVRAYFCDLANDSDVARLVDEYGSLANMVFVDAAHDYQSVCRDIATARKLLAPNGLLCGHDFHDTWPGVCQAVREMVPGYGVADGTTIWFAT